MDHDHNKCGKGGGNAFIFGVLVGSAVALLFSTKTGRRILNRLTEEGIDKFKSLEDLLEEKIDEKMQKEFGDMEDFEELVEVPLDKDVKTAPHAKNAVKTKRFFRRKK